MVRRLVRKRYRACVDVLASSNLASSAGRTLSRFSTAKRRRNDSFAEARMDLETISCNSVELNIPCNQGQSMHIAVGNKGNVTKGWF